MKIFCLLFLANLNGFHLLFVGDIMGHEPQIVSAEIEKNISYNYDPCFEFVKPFLEKADLTIGNLEVTLPGKPPYTGFPRFRSPDALAFSLKNAGFDLLFTANNHCNDAGPAGLIQTLQTLDDFDILHTGTFRNKRERKVNYPLIIDKDGFKLAFLNYTYGTNKIPTKPPTFVNLIHEQLIKRDMQIARELKPDAIIVMMHWGKEYHTQESRYQRIWAKKLFEWGALLVVGAHPHVLQPIREEIVNGKKRVVAYSLGNFISGQTRPNTDCTVMLEVELVKESGKTRIDTHSYIPVWRYIQKTEGKKNTYIAVPISDPPEELNMSEEERKTMKRCGNWIHKHLS